MNRLLVLLLALWAGVGLAGGHSTQQPSAGQARELMGSVCPGGALTGACAVCPTFVEGGGLGGTMTLEAVTYGHFLNGQETYALLDLSGCEPHAANFGGSVLLRWRGLKNWAFVKYLPGLRSGECQTYPAPGGRDLLLCENTYMGMGIIDTALFPVDVRRAVAGPDDQSVGAPLFSLEDSTEACSATVSVQSLVSWQQVKLNAGAFPDLRVRVRSGSGTSTRTFERCDAPAPNISTRAYTLDYLFDGHTFVPTPATRATLRRLLKDNPYLLGAD